MKIVQFANGKYAIRKFSLLEFSWVYLDLVYAFRYIQGTLISLRSVRMWKTRTHVGSGDCFSIDFEKVLYIYNNFRKCLDEPKKNPYDVVKVYSDYELKAATPKPPRPPKQR